MTLDAYYSIVCRDFDLKGRSLFFYKKKCANMKCKVGKQ